MDRVIYLSMAGAKATMQRQDVLANNLANASTSGFRAELQAFRAVPVRGDGASTRVYALESTVGHDLRSGPIQTTGRGLDVAPVGAGPEDRTYPYYYVVVRGQSPNLGNGRYRVDLSFTATDDHPDGSTTEPFVAPPATVYDNAEYSFATNVAVDSSTGRGNATGTIAASGSSAITRSTLPRS